MGKRINTKAFIIARESRGLTQIELSEKTCIPQSNISKYENENLAIDENDLIKIAAILKYPLSFFYQDMEMYPPNLYYRKKASASAKIITKAEAEMNIYRENVQKLMRSVDLSAYNLPNSEDMKNLTPEDVARHLRVFWNIPKGPISNLTKLVEDKGVIVIHNDFDSDKIDGRSMQSNNGVPIIFINKNSSGDRQRLTLAHELGHIVMHINSTYSFEVDVEAEAFTFGAEFLMPKSEIYPYLTGKLTIAKLADLKRYWKVSMQAILVWAQKLGAITNNHARYLWSQFSAMRIKIKEPIDIMQEKPTLIDEMINLHLNDLNYSKEELSSLLCLLSEEFEDKYFQMHRTIRIVR